MGLNKPLQLGISYHRRFLGQISVGEPWIGAAIDNKDSRRPLTMCRLSDIVDNGLSPGNNGEDGNGPKW